MILFANDTHYGLVGNALVPGKFTLIQMKEETIHLTLYDDYFEIDVEFIFENRKRDQELVLGFPVLYGSNIGKIYDFKSWINGIEIQREYLPIEQDNGDHLIVTEGDEYTKTYYSYKIDNAYAIPALFKTGITTSRINYKSIYRLGSLEFNNNGHSCSVNMYDSISYYYGSGKTWWGNIEKINVIVTNKSSHILSFISKSEEWLWIGDNELTYGFENVDPEYSDILIWGVESFINTNYSYLERFNLLRKGVKYDWDHKKDDLNYFTKKIKYLTKNQLRILRNAYYAIHGYKFASKDLQDIFSKCSWYKINPNYSDELLTSFDKKVISIIQEEENSRK